LSPLDPAPTRSASPPQDLPVFLHLGEQPRSELPQRLASVLVAQDFEEVDGGLSPREVIVQVGR
jgi:hypothetical protein